MLRNFPHAEDHAGTAGGDTDKLIPAKARPVSFQAAGVPPGEDGTTPGRGRGQARGYGARARPSQYLHDELENEASAAGLPGPPPAADQDIDFLQLVREAEDQALLYVAQVNRKAWSQSYRAFHNEHFVGSKYSRPDWRARSKIFRPKTRSAVRKDMSAVAASMFSNIDAINCLPGNESDPCQCASAAILQELVNYRTDRASGKAAMPWFAVCMGARQDALIAGVCLTKQSWKLELRKLPQASATMVQVSEGVFEERLRDAYVKEIDRPDCQLIPPENYVIDPAADWTDPVQSAAYLIIKWPMRIEEIKRKQEAPISPWLPVAEQTLRSSLESGKFDMAAIRRAREMGLDRLDETQTGTYFQVVWVYENFIRYGGEDWTFFSVGDRDYLTEPKPTREVYPEQFGERPIAMGYGMLESHRIFPMSPVESWQMHQVELNDIANLALDAIKQNVTPVSKVRRGAQVDLDQLKRRAHGSSIMVQKQDDITWDRPPDIPQSVPMMVRDLELELDDLAGQFNGQTAENSNALSRTLGGLKLVSGSANALQEFDIRLWIETWAVRALAQIVRLEQYYENDPVVLGLCGERAQLMQKHGIDRIDDALLEQEITVRVSVGLGAGDPQQRLAKFNAAIQVALPLLQNAPQFQGGEMQINPEAVMEEVFGAAGYRDGGARFVMKGQAPKPNPMMDLKTKELEAKIARDERAGQAAMLGGLAQVAKVALGHKRLEAEVVDSLLSHKTDALKIGFEHGHMHNQGILSALDHGHRHGRAVADARARQQTALDAAQPEGLGRGGDTPASGVQSTAAPAAATPPSAEPPQQQVIFVRDPRTGQIVGARVLGGPQRPAGNSALPYPLALSS
ncbi:MAG: hypothetical protein ACLPKB_24795 [Xanthobacteraceae bacterium]